MANWIKETGFFVLGDVQVRVREFERSNAVALNVRGVVLEDCDVDNSLSIGCLASGNIFIIDKKGRALDVGLETLMKSLGWDGDLSSLEDRAYPEVKVKVDHEEYDGKDFYKVSRVYPVDFTPSSGVTTSLMDRVGKVLKAKARGIQNEINAEQQRAKMKKPEPITPEVVDDDDIPF